jgi:MAF protein
VNKQLFLASNSPRRKELLSLAGWEYHHLPVQVDENPLPGEAGNAYVVRIASTKATSARQLVEGHAVIISADTAVLGNTAGGMEIILGKPRDAGEAADMLRSLRGRLHQVVTAITILRIEDGAMVCDRCTTQVPMRDYSDAEIEAYVSSGDPLDKAGAYAIQHAGFHPVEHLAGCYANVMGLPLCHLTRMLGQFGLQPCLDVPSACQAGLGYNCPVYQDILSEEKLGIPSA